MAGCREMMDGTEKLHEAGFWPSPEKVFDSTLSDTGIKSYQHMHQRAPVTSTDGDTEVPKLVARSL